MRNLFIRLLYVAFLIGASWGCTEDTPPLTLAPGDHIVLIGNNLGSRMMNYGFFETELHLRYPDHQLFVRNLCDGGDTPGFRAHSGRNSPWAFPGAEKFQTELARNSGSEGTFEYPDQWLSRLQADIIIAFFGYNESFEGEAGLQNFKEELHAFVIHSLNQKYNDSTAPLLALVSPIGFEDLSAQYDLPDGVEENHRLKMYTEAILEVADSHNLPVVNAYKMSQEWYAGIEEPLTIDGFQLNETGYSLFSNFLADQLFRDRQKSTEAHIDMIREAVLEKNWMWQKDYKVPNGVHVFGRRYNPFGPDNYPAELKKVREMTAIRDSAIWKATTGERLDLATADAHTSPLPAVETNFQPPEGQEPAYLYGEDALASFKLAPGYHLELFASEEDFEDLANPVQLSFDNQGRLWVATMPSYPHYRPGDALPNDKILILEDTDGDGKADKQTTFADQLHLPTGFEITEDGVYISQGTNLMLYRDTDGDDQADQKEIVLSGFDDHDTHHVISAYCADPSGAIYMAEGVFLHTNVETAYGPVRATNGGFFRYNPRRFHLERTAQIPIPNPWGIAFDRWGQNFFCETSGPDVRWMMPATIKPRYGVSTDKSYNLIEEDHRVRPTSGLEFVSSRHFPDEVQGDLLINNTIGFLGTKQHQFTDDGTGYQTRHRFDLLQSTDFNFRPVDMEFAPDGSLYLVDWHNVLIGHMQHNARDPLRDHDHGRIYRITYPSRPLVDPPQISGASLEQLLDNLKLPEYRARYRTKRELRGRNQEEVAEALESWLSQLDGLDPQYEHHQLEGLWVSWGINKVHVSLLEELLTEAKDYKIRAAAVRVLRYMRHQIPNSQQLFLHAAGDEHGRVRLEAIVAASWLETEQGLEILNVASGHPLDRWMQPAFETAQAHLNGHSIDEKQEQLVNVNLKGQDLELFQEGQEIYQREGFCITCHQTDGGGLDASGFPPLKNTQWVMGPKERLIKITLNGLIGPIEVLGKSYPGQVPMTPYRGLLNDREIAAVLTYVRKSFGNDGSVIYPEDVSMVRSATEQKQGFYTAEDLIEPQSVILEED